MSKKEKKIVFLTGVGRSGTTILQSMLHAHNQINFPPETHFFKRYILRYLTGKKVNEEKIKHDVYLNRLNASKREAVLASDFNSLDDLKQLFLKIMESDSPDIVCIGDKDTEYVRYIPHLKYLFPQSYLINIKRDPRDVIASRLKTEWGSKRSLNFHVAEYQYYIKKVGKDGKKHFNDRFIELRYEDLIEKPEVELKRILKSLDIEFQPQMLEFYKKSNELVAIDEAKWKQNISKPLNSSNKGKWSKSINNDQAALIEKGIEDFMKNNDYQTLDNRVNLIARLQVLMLKGLFIGKSFKERLQRV